MSGKLRAIAVALQWTYSAVVFGAGGEAAQADRPSPHTEGAAWCDGTPVVRFDKGNDAPMTPAADWSDVPAQRWAGPAIWTNRLQDWVVADGALRCEPAEPLPCRTAHLLTYDLQDAPGPFRVEVILTLAAGSPLAGWAGFLVGAGEGRLDHRGAALVHHTPGKGGGLLAVVETSGDGRLAFRDMTQDGFPLLPDQTTVARQPIRLDYHRMMVNLEGVPRADGRYDVRLSVWAEHAGDLLGAVELCGVPAERLRGNVALAAHPVQGARHQFEDLRVGGDRLAHHPERAFGPVAGTLYSVSGGTLKLGAQFMSVGSASRTGGRKTRRPRPAARLEIRPSGGPDDAPWSLVDGPHVIAPPDYYVLFRAEDWDATRDWETRVVYEDGRSDPRAYRTVVRHDPLEQPVVSVAGFTGMGVMGHVASQNNPEPEPGQVAMGKWTPANVWMPFEAAVRAIDTQQNVDLLCFTGDQIYQSKPTATDPGRMPFEDYLYKWLLWHWSFRDLTNHTPAIVQPDDHDVYHGNLWGWGGRLCPNDYNGSGGYICSPGFVNVVHRTQTGHLPDPYDPALARNGITNYYTGFTYGGIGFAVLEDRKFKTPPSIEDPLEQVLLGERQLEFLEAWGEDWAGQRFKTVVSQSVYAAMHTDSDGTLARDPDSNGFPKVGRDRALRLFRRCSALVLCGDQHLGTFARLGVEAPSDAVYQFCVPAIGNIFWRWFYPATPGAGRAPGEPDYLGEFVGAWGNPFRMVAVANPERKTIFADAGSIRRRHAVTEAEAERGLGDSKRTCLGDGYGIVRFNKPERTVTVECWPHNAKPEEGDGMFAGWPVTLAFDDLDGRRPVAWLPDLDIEGDDDPVVHIIDQASGAVIKTVRTVNGHYRPGVFDANATYAVRVFDPERPEACAELRDLTPGNAPGGRSITIDLTH